MDNAWIVPYLSIFSKRNLKVTTQNSNLKSTNQILNLNRITQEGYYITPTVRPDFLKFFVFNFLINFFFQKQGLIFFIINFYFINFRKQIIFTILYFNFFLLFLFLQLQNPWLDFKKLTSYFPMKIHSYFSL